MNSFVKEKAFYKKILLICLPIALQQLITVGINMIDTLMLGRVSETALAASSMATQVHMLFAYIALGTGTGASIMYARYWGRRDLKSLKVSVTLSYRFLLAAGIVYTLAAAFFPEAIMKLLTTDPIIVEAGTRYLNWTVPCYLFQGLQIVSTSVLRNVGKLNYPLYNSIVAFFINIFFNWVFIFGKLGAPEMGIAGAALGTTIARVVEAGSILVYMFGIEKGLGYRLKDLFLPCRKLVREFFKITGPTIVSDVLLGLGQSLTTAVAGRISQAFMAGNSITAVVQSMAVIFSSALGQSSQIVIGNTLGEGKPKRAKLESNTFMLLSILIGIVIGALIVLTAHPIADGYRLSKETNTVAVQLLQAQGISVVFMIPAGVITKGVLRAGGDTAFLMVADVIFLWMISVPFGYLFGVVWHLSPFLVFLMLKSEHFLKLILCMIRYATGKWIKNIKGYED